VACGDAAFRGASSAGGGDIIAPSGVRVLSRAAAAWRDMATRRDAAAAAYGARAALKWHGGMAAKKHQWRGGGISAKKKKMKTAWRISANGVNGVRK
jgi:hypothetical protein